MKTLFAFSFVLSVWISSSMPGRAEEPGQDWNQWRGPNRDSKVDSKWPTSLSESNLNKVWSKPFGPSYSGPIVLKDTVFTTETKDKRSEVVTALDAVTGEKKWSAEWQGAMTVPFFASKNGSWIRSTPATDGERLYVAGIKGLMVCLDIKTGKELWKLNFSNRYKTQPESFGHVCSPLIIAEEMDNAIYIQCAAGFLKLNRLTGEEIWRSLDDGGGMMTGGAFSSPVVATLDGQKQIVVQTRTLLAGVDLKTGKVFWKQKVPAFRGMNILTPSVLGNQVFTSSYNNKSYGYTIARKGDGFQSTEKWSSPMRAYMSSPVVVNDHAYLHLQNRQIACFDLETGENKWVSKNRKRFGDYWSMISNGKQILALDSGGVLYLMNANPDQFELVGKVKLGTDDSWAHLAVVGNKVFVRGIKSLAVYQWE